MTSDNHDISSRDDIILLVNSFYASVRADSILGPIFDDVAHTDWDTHLPKMYDFWETVLFGTTTGFRGNPLAVHLDLASRVPLGAREFGRWIELFHRNVDMLFAGLMAEDAKARALRIAAVMQHHIANSADSLPQPA